MSLFSQTAAALFAASERETAAKYHPEDSHPEAPHCVCSETHMIEAADWMLDWAVNNLEKTA